MHNFYHNTYEWKSIAFAIVIALALIAGAGIVAQTPLLGVDTADAQRGGDPASTGCGNGTSGSEGPSRDRGCVTQSEHDFNCRSQRARDNAPFNCYSVTICGDGGRRFNDCLTTRQYNACNDDRGSDLNCDAPICRTPTIPTHESDTEQQSSPPSGDQFPSDSLGEPQESDSVPGSSPGGEGGDSGPNSSWGGDDSQGGDTSGANRFQGGGTDSSGFDGQPPTFTPPPPSPPTINITADPWLVRQGDSTMLTWSSQNTSSCTVAGDNGDSWSGTSGTQTTAPIQTLTIFTLSCQADDGSSPSKTVQVRVVPVFQEF